MVSNNCISKMITDVFPLCLNTHMNAPEQQHAKSSAFMEVFTLALLIISMCVWLAVPGRYLAH